VVPVPVREIVKFELLASERTLMLPVVAAADDGENLIVNVTLCPPPRLAGSVNPLTVKSDPETVAPVRLIALEPGLVNVSVSFSEVAILTRPKSIVLELDCSCFGGAEFPELNP
jgi:hypothetical protein